MHRSAAHPQIVVGLPLELPFLDHRAAHLLEQLLVAFERLGSRVENHVILTGPVLVRVG